MRLFILIVIVLIGLLMNLGGCSSTPVSSSSGNSFFWQAHEPTWDDPSINPVFDTKAEAEQYAKENNMGNHHSYQVREVNFRYEVRQHNDLINDLLHTARSFNDAYGYVVEYSSSHSDLIIYDLKTGKIFKETP